MTSNKSQNNITPILVLNGKDRYNFWFVAQ